MVGRVGEEALGSVGAIGGNVNIKTNHACYCSHVFARKFPSSEILTLDNFFEAIP